MKTVIKESFVCYYKNKSIDFDINEIIKVIDIGFDDHFLTEVFITFESKKTPHLFTCDLGLILENKGRNDFSQKIEKLIQKIRNYLSENDKEKAFNCLKVHFNSEKFGL